VKVTVTCESPDGTAINASYRAKYDGREAQVTGNAPYDTIAIKQVNASTLPDERRKAGAPHHATGETVISGRTDSPPQDDILPYFAGVGRRPGI
jgi:hypothetical protein